MDSQFNMYRDVTLAAVRSLDIEEALVKTYAAFSKYLPLSAISFQEYRADLQAAKIYYLIIPDGSWEMDMVVPINDEAVKDMLRVRKPHLQA